MQSSEISKFPIILTEGGDDRLVLDPKTGVNKYYSKPEVCPDVLFRGSCTCNLPTALAFEKAKELHTKLKAGSLTIEDGFEQVRERIKKFFNVPEGTGIFLTPSGSDAEYVPVMIAKALNEGKAISNIVTCNEEVGSGTLAAANGQFFSPIEPITGFTDGAKKNGDAVDGLADGVTAIPIPAREVTGEPTDSKAKISELLKDIESQSQVPIVHSVYGSKTGICEAFPADISAKVQELGGFLVLDACQGRFKQEMLHNALSHECCVLFTGSKFFRGPPFSGGVFISKSIMDQVKGTSTDLPHGLHTFVGKSEIPQELESWRSTAKPSVNYGLLLRWEAALAEMEASAQIPEEQRFAQTSDWRKEVIKMVEPYDCLDYFAAAHDTDSIVSVSAKNPQGSDRPFLNKSEMAKIFKAMTIDVSSMFDTEEDKAVAARICFIGQPVQITKEWAILRIALGSDSQRQLNSDFAGALSTDKQIVEKMALLASNFNKL